MNVTETTQMREYYVKKKPKASAVKKMYFSSKLKSNYSTINNSK